MNKPMLCCEQPIMTRFIDLLMEPLRVKPCTMHLVRNLVFKTALDDFSAEEKCAFGIQTPDHVQALQMVFHAGLFDGDLLEIIKQLDAAAYQGAALSDLIAVHAPYYYNHLTFVVPKETEPDSKFEDIPF